MAARGSDPVGALRSLAGADSVLTERGEVEPYVVDHLRLYRGRALAVVLPRSADEVCRVLAFCNERRIGVVPQGGNTGYVGGCVPDDSGHQVVLALRRLNRIRAIDQTNYSMVAEAGCVLADVQRAAEAVDRYFPLALGSQGSCQIGGNLATNAGGLNVLRYGMTRDLVLGIEVALADGSLLSGLTPLRKDNTGYDLRSLFIGAEGTLGVITAASLKLLPQPRSLATAFCAVPSVGAAVALLGRLREASGDRVSSFELVPRIGIELTARHIAGVGDPLPGAHPWYVLCELASSRADDALEPVLQDALAAALEAGLVLDAALAQSGRERAAFWKLRESIPAAQRALGASLRHDVSVPISRLAELVERGSAWVAANIRGGTLVCYGHVGDGNLHFNVGLAAGADRAAFLAQQETLQRAVHDLVAGLGGSFSAEHGIGQRKVEELERYAAPAELALMRAVKAAFDPQGIMNPGKVLRGRDRRN
ncbi:MAG: FAD-binding oxidoreductase [Steroidobacteraceae bacterium]